MVLVISAVVMCAASGCSDSQSGEFKTYRELESGSAVQTVDTSAAPIAVESSKPAIPSKESTTSGRPPISAEQPVAEQPAAASQVQTPTQDSAANTKTPPVETNVTPVDPASASAAATTQPAGSAEPRKVELLVPHKEFRVEGPAGALRISFDDFDLLKILNMEPVTPDAPNLLPSWLKGLEGKRVRVRGFMYPPFEETGIRVFVLARDNQICCFGRDPKVYDLVKIVMREGESTNYIQNRPFDVVGIFQIRPDEEDGKLLQLYQMTDAQVIDK